MIKIVDANGRIFKRWNIVDFLVFVFIFCLMPMFYFTYKVMSKESELPPIKTYYKIIRPCPNCGKNIEIDTIEDEGIVGILKGELLPEFYEADCPKCGSRVVLIDKCLTPPSSLPPSPPNFTQMLDELLYEEKMLEIKKREEIEQKTPLQ